MKTTGRWIGAALLGALLWAQPVAAQAPAAATAPEAVVPAPRPDDATAPRPDGGTTPRPAIWLLADEDTRIYLFGTIHILPPGLEWRSAAIERVIAEADELVMEVGEEPNEAQEAAIADMFLLGKTVPILSRVAPERRAPLAEMIAASGVPAEGLDAMQPWAVAMMLGVGQYLRELSGDSGVAIDELTGVEDALQADFVRLGRPISGVETAEQQIGFFARLPFAVQNDLLAQTIDAYAAGQPAPEAGTDDVAWARGDTAAVERLMQEMPPALFDVLITRRNRVWTDWLAERLERPGTVLFAVGAGHLAGRDSVQAMLEARGFTVRRID